MDKNMKKVRGFTLIEIMIVLVIMGIVAAIALPSYQSSMTKARRSDARSALLDLAARSEKFFAQNNSYTTEVSATTGLGLARTISLDGYYNLSAAACAGGAISRCYVLTAAATGAQAGDDLCATFSLDSVGRKTAAKSNSNANPDCW